MGLDLLILVEQSVAALTLIKADGSFEDFPGLDDCSTSMVFIGERLFEAQVPLLFDAMAVAEHAGLRVSGQPRCQFFGCRPGETIGHKAVGQPHVEGLAGFHRSSRKDHVHGSAHADQARKTNRAAVDQWDAEAAAEHSQHRTLRNHAQVTPQGKLQSTCHGTTLYGRNYRLAKAHSGGAHRAVACFTNIVGCFGRNGLKTCASAKTPAFPVKYGYKGLIVTLEIVKGYRKGSCCWSIDRVACLGSVDTD